jgi:iron(III) transport system ATP-binding protein
MIQTDDLTKSFRTEHETVHAMDSLDLQVEPHSFFTLLGPSGCGKSTLLRCIAGLERPDAGAIRIGERTVFSSANGVNLPPNRRHIGMVFQSYAIWPHMTVFENVAFPLQVRRMGGVKERVGNALAIVGLDHVADRYASRLSGGQQQRIAFARAVVAEPEVLLLDEPLSNLDAALREQMRSELRKFQERLGITTVYVTHDQAEALSMSDRIAVMEGGRFVEIGAPEELYDRPRKGFTARFLGGANILEGTVERADDGLRVRAATGLMRTASHLALAPGAKVDVFMRPERIRLAEAGEECGDNRFEAVIESQRFVGDGREVELILPDAPEIILRAKFPPRCGLSRGERVTAAVEPAGVLVLEEG